MYKLFVQTAINFTKNRYKIKMSFMYDVTDMSRDSSVGIATGYGLDDRMIGV
jgi:hypothetical protein